MSLEATTEPTDGVPGDKSHPVTEPGSPATGALKYGTVGDIDDVKSSKGKGVEGFALFPSAFKIYKEQSGALYTLAESSARPLYALTSTRGLVNTKPLVLRSGPDADSSPPLATVEFNALRTRLRVAMHLAASSTAAARPEGGPVDGIAGGQGIGAGATASKAETTEEVRLVSRGLRAVDPLRFSIETGSAAGGPKEEFEWRHSSGSVVASLGGASKGWKLVRLAASTAETKADGKGYKNQASKGSSSKGGRKGDEDDEYGSPVEGEYRASDGNEVVAVWATVRTRPTVVSAFSFLGSGESGVLGQRWALMAVATALATLDMEQKARGPMLW